jgi:hypothetical protein
MKAKMAKIQRMGASKRDDQEEQQPLLGQLRLPRARARSQAQHHQDGKLQRHQRIKGMEALSLLRPREAVERELAIREPRNKPKPVVDNFWLLPP